MSRESLGSFRLPTILCAFHPNETIEHFCHSRQCMLPLCKVCTSIHQKQHKSMTSPPMLVEIDALMQTINQQIEGQKQDVLRKHSAIKRFYRVSSDIHQDGIRRMEENREKAIEEVNQRYNAIIAEMGILYQQKIVELRTIHVKLEVLQSTLDLVKGTFSKTKPMRTVILWESNGLGGLGADLLREIDEKIQNDQNHQLFTNNYFMESQCALKPQMKMQADETEIKTLNRYLSLLGSIIEMDIDTRDSKDIKRSFIKLRSSGISLTEVSIIKSDTKRSKDSIKLSTPEKTQHGIRLRELGREIKSGRLKQ